MSENKWRVYISDVSPSGGESTGTYQIITQETEPTLSIAGNEIDSGKTSLIKQRFDVGTIRTNTIVESTASAGITINPTAAGPSMFFTNPYMTRIVTTDSSQNAITNTVKIVDFTIAKGGSVDYDTTGSQMGLTETNRISIPRSGLYMIKGKVVWGETFSSNALVKIRCNGSTTLLEETAGSITALDSQIVTDIVDLTSGDYIDLIVIQTSGSNKRLGNLGLLLQHSFSAAYMGDL